MVRYDASLVRYEAVHFSIGGTVIFEHRVTVVIHSFGVDSVLLLDVKYRW